MAAVVESVAFPRTPPALRRMPPPSPASPVSVAPRAALLPEAVGLKISRRPARPPPAARAGNAEHRGAVVCEAPETAVQVPVVTTSTWQSLVMKSDRMVLVSFWAPWCGPCRMIHPVIAEIAAEYSGKLNSFELNTDDNPDTATQHGIRSIPTVIFFKDGEKKDAIIGAVPKSTLIAAIEKFL